MIERLCKLCHKNMKAYSTLQNKCNDCLKKTYKPIPQKGKATKIYEVWRDKVARPYLDKRYGIACSSCGVMPPKKDDGTYYRHDADHKATRGSKANLKMQVTNMQYLCRNCHDMKGDGVLHWSKHENTN